MKRQPRRKINEALRPEMMKFKKLRTEAEDALPRELRELEVSLTFIDGDALGIL